MTLSQFYQCSRFKLHNYDIKFKNIHLPVSIQKRIIVKYRSVAGDRCGIYKRINTKHINIIMVIVKGDRNASDQLQMIYKIKRLLCSRVKIN